MISGKQGSGKTTLAKHLSERITALGYKPVFIKFADPIYEMHNMLLKYMERLGFVYDGVKHGPLLQFLGTEFGRKTFGENVWADIAAKKADEAEDNPIVIIDDLRFRNEFASIPESIKVRLVAPADIRKERCDNWRENETHQSEIDLDDWLDKFDLAFDTSGYIPSDVIAKEVMDLVVKETTNT